MTFKFYVGDIGGLLDDDVTVQKKKIKQFHVLENLMNVDEKCTEARLCTCFLNLRERQLFISFE